MKLKIFLITLILLFLAALLVRQQKLTLQSAVRTVIATCKSANYRPACYEREIPKLLGRLTMEETFGVTQLVQDEDPSYLYCHVLAHKISFAESARHPDQWKDILARCPAAQCNYGCLHGSLIQRFRGETLTDQQITEVIPDLFDICEPRKGFSPTPIDRTMCYHALGHLGMYITGGKPDKAVPICEKISKKQDKDFTDTCVQGAFMTVFQGVDPEDIALVKAIKPKKEDVAAFCKQYGVYWESCRRESYPYFRTEILAPGGFEKFCAYAGSQETYKNCALGVLNIVADTFFEKPDGLDLTKDYCSLASALHQSLCYSGIAQRLVQIDPIRHIETAVNICREADRAGLANACWDDVAYYGTVSFSKGSPDRKKYCQNLPENKRIVCEQ